MFKFFALLRVEKYGKNDTIVFKDVNGIYEVTNQMLTSIII